MEFVREHYVELLRNGYVLKSTSLETGESLQTFIANEDFYGMDVIAQKELVDTNFELIENELRDLAESG